MTSAAFVSVSLRTVPTQSIRKRLDDEPEPRGSVNRHCAADCQWHVSEREDEMPHGHTHTPPVFGIWLVIAMALNGGYGLFQLYQAWREVHSLALLTDSFHNISDVLSIGILWMGVAFATSQRIGAWAGADGRGERTAAFLNYGSLFVLVLGTMLASLYRMFDPANVSGEGMSKVAAVGIGINLGTCVMLHLCAKGNRNIRAAFWHQFTDLVFSFGVAVTGLLIALTGWNVLDPVVTIALSAAILRMIWGGLVDTWSRLRGEAPSHEVELTTCGHHDHAGHAH